MQSLTSLYTLRAVAFGRLFQALDGEFYQVEESTIVPDLVASAYGTVLELGPGTGNQLSRYDIDRLHHVYGVEPNPVLGAALRKKVKETGLSDIYTPIACGIEENEILHSFGLVEGSVDCVLSIQVLCSVPQPDATLKSLYKLLKPGGQLIFWEHHESNDPITRIVQRFWNVVWPFAIGGCSLSCTTKKWLLEAGDWEVIQMVDDEEAGKNVGSMLPRISGRLRKIGGGTRTKSG